MGAKSAKAEGGARGVTADQFREAERGARLILAKNFSAAWITKNARDLLAQANIEYAAWLKDNPPARNPVGWLLNCVYWRAQNLLDAESRRPPTASLDAVFHLPDESTPDPERQALDHDRQSRLQEALSHLPEKEQELLALVYYENHSIREAGRKLGWRKSAADRHHRAAMEKMLALVGDRTLLSPAILGPAAWAVLNAEGRRSLLALRDPLREAVALGTEAASIAAHRLGELARRLSPFADAGNAAAAGGGGRVLGYCGATAGVLVCGLLGSGAVGPGLGSWLPDSTAPHKPRAANTRRISSAPIAAPTPSTPELALPTQPDSSQAPKDTEPVKPAERQERRSRSRFPRASGEQSADEFGDNNFGPNRSAESTAPAEAPAEPAPAPPPPGSSRSRSGSQAASEFGL